MLLKFIFLDSATLIKFILNKFYSFLFVLVFILNFFLDLAFTSCFSCLCISFPVLFGWFAVSVVYISLLSSLLPVCSLSLYFLLSHCQSQYLKFFFFFCLLLFFFYFPFTRAFFFFYNYFFPIFLFLIFLFYFFCFLFCFKFFYM